MHPKYQVSYPRRNTWQKVTEGEADKNNFHVVGKYGTFPTSCLRHALWRKGRKGLGAVAKPPPLKNFKARKPKYAILSIFKPSVRWLNCKSCKTKILSLLFTLLAWPWWWASSLRGAWGLESCPLCSFLESPVHVLDKIWTERYFMWRKIFFLRAAYHWGPSNTLPRGPNLGK